MLYLTTHSTHYLQLYGIRHMVKDNTDSEKGNLLSLHRILFLINSRGSLICIIHIGRKTGRYVGRLYTHTHRWMDGRTDGWTDGQTDESHSYADLF